MKTYKLLIITVILLNSLQGIGQKYSISGFAIDNSSGEKIIGANVYDTRTEKGTITNEYGFFSLSLDSDTIDLFVSFIGYNTYKNTFFLDSNISLNIQLDPILRLSEVLITDKKSETLVKSTQMGMVELPIQAIKSLPSFMGESDILKALQLTPGVQSGSEGASGMYVRGGSPDQTLIILDGVPVYNVSHLFGFFSVFNSDALSNVKLIKGGFPARYGGRLSSVLDIRMKEGNLKSFHAEGSLGIIASKLTLEGPIIKDKMSFLLSARRTYIDVLAAPFVKKYGKGTSGGYYFYDGNAKINYQISDKDRIFLSFYGGQDKASLRNKDKDGGRTTFVDGEYVYKDQNIVYKSKNSLLWGNITGCLRWNHIFNSRLFANTSLTYSNYKFDISLLEQTIDNKKLAHQQRIRFFSGIEDISANIDFDYRPLPRHSVKFGGKYIFHNFKPGIANFSEINLGYSDTSHKIGKDNIKGNEYFAYIEDDWDINGLFKINLGIHASGFHVNNKFYNSIQPRIAARFLVNDKLSIKASYAEMAQYIHLVSSSTIGLPNDLWVPSTDNVIPERSRQASIGSSYNINNNWDMNIEGFYKTMDNLIEYKEGTDFMSSFIDWESAVTSGKGWAYGAEILLRKNYGKFTGWIGYTLSWSWRKFEELNFGEKFPFKYDRRHDISIVGLYKLNDKIDFGATWVYGTGNGVTIPLMTHTTYNNGGPINLYNHVEYYGSRNSFRMPSYHRLDISANFHKKKKNWERTWSIGFYNVYSRSNPFFLYVDNYYSGEPTDLEGNPIEREYNDELIQVSLFPIMPFINYSFKF